MNPGSASVFITSLPSFAEFTEVFTFNPQPGDLGVHAVSGYLSDGVSL
jgi:hypothetical protein